jgi:isochorismate pyruvate lyase
MPPAKPALTPTDDSGQCRSMAEVRENIDAIDLRIIDLLAERAGFVRQAARIKGSRTAVVDPPRIEEVVAKVRAAARDRGLPPDLAEAAYRLMIDRFIALEAEEFDRLSGAPAGDG